MPKILLLCCLVFCGFTSSAQSQDTTLSLYFPVNEHQLEEAQKSQLTDFLNNLDQERIIASQLTAFCDAPGSTEYNRALGHKRLNSVLAELPNFIRDSLSQSLNMGDQGKDDTAYADRMRRVDLKITLKPEPVYPTLSVLYAQMQSNLQSFEINPSKDTIIVCEQGTQIYIHANSFKGVNRKKELTIEVTEVLKKSDMLMYNLSTTSNDEILESGGMLKITARQGNKKLRLNRNKNLEIMIPTESPLENAEVFAGQIHGGDSLNWLPRSRPILDDGSAWGFLRCCGTVRLEDCNFWCRISRFFGQRNSVRSTQDYYRSCSILSHYLRKYNAKDLKELKQVVSEKLDGGDRNANDSGPIRTNLALYEGLRELDRRERLAEIAEREARMANGEASKQDLNYYLFETSNLGWINIDSFSKQPSWRLTRLEVPVAMKSHTQVKMIFRNRNSILNANGTYGRGFYFKDIPKNQDVIIVAIQYFRGSIKVATQDLKIGEELPPLQFQKLSMDEFKSFWQNLEV